MFPLLVPPLLEGVLGTSAHVPVSVSLTGAGLILIYLLVFAARERARSRRL